MQPIKRKVKIPAGATWKDSFLWTVSPYIYKDATVTRGLPTTLTVTNHGIPAGAVYPVYISGSGALKINSVDNVPTMVRRIDVNTLVIDGVDTTTKPAVSGVKVSYLTPKNLTGWTANLEFRLLVSSTPLLTLTTISGITIADSMITVHPTPSNTRALLNGALLDTTGTAHLELIAPNAEITRLIEYAWTATEEWTRV